MIAFWNDIYDMIFVVWHEKEALCNNLEGNVVFFFFFKKLFQHFPQKTCLLLATYIFIGVGFSSYGMTWT